MKKTDASRPPVRRLLICGVPAKEFAIVLPQDPSAAEEFAATRLGVYLEKATGFEIPRAKAAKNAIYIGRAADINTSKLEHDGFALKTDKDSLHLAGKIDRGTHYAVNEFLEKYIGLRIYEKDVERIHPAEEVSVPAGLEEYSNPLFSMRRTSYANTREADFALWMRFNSQFAKVDKEHGGAVMFWAGGSSHTFDKLCPSELYFDEHPEYFSLWEGRRIPGGNVFDRPVGQLCLTNPDVLRIVTENVFKYIEQAPDREIVDISQNDNGRYCECENCAAVDAEEGSPSGLMLRFVNAVAKEVAKKYPNIMVQTFAYQYTRKPPKITKPDDNVIVRLCSIECCFRHKQNRGCEQNEGFADDIAIWGKLAKNLSIWDYTVNYNDYYASLPNIDSLFEDASYYADNNAKHIYEQSSSNGGPVGEFGALRTYLIGKLLWNPYMSRQEYDYHINDFLEGYFGPGWQSIREYLGLLMETTKDWHVGCFAAVNPISDCGDYEVYMNYEPKAFQPLREKKHYLTEFLTHLPQLRMYWDDAMAKAEDNDTRFRIKRAAMSLDYLELFCTAHNRETMSPEEIAAYKAACAEFLWKQELFGQYTTENTSRRKHGQG